MSRVGRKCSPDSPSQTSGRSKNASNGWNPNVFFHVAAAYFF
jgi:hypothetical protein